MAKLVWDAVGQRFWQTGVNQGVLFLPNTGELVPWNGLISVTQRPTGSEILSYYYDGQKYDMVATNEDFDATIEAYTYPMEFERCEGTAFDAYNIAYGQQDRVPFHFSYRTLVGNDIVGENYAYQIHLVYNALATSTEKSHSSIGNDTSPATFTWDISTIPVEIPELRPTAHIVFDSRRVNAQIMRNLENFLYGSANNDPGFPMVEDLNDLRAIYRFYPDVDLYPAINLYPGG